MYDLLHAWITDSVKREKELFAHRSRIAKNQMPTLMYELLSIQAHICLHVANGIGVEMKKRGYPTEELIYKHMFKNVIFSVNDLSKQIPGYEHHAITSNLKKIDDHLQEHGIKKNYINDIGYMDVMAKYFLMKNMTTFNFSALQDATEGYDELYFYTHGRIVQMINEALSFAEELPDILEG